MPNKEWKKVRNEMLSAQQVADAIGITQRGVQYHAESAINAGVAARVGKVVVYHLSAIEWFNNKRV